MVSQLSRGGAVLLYGSVATGQAVLGRSDVDLLTVACGLPGPPRTVDV